MDATSLFVCTYDWGKFWKGRFIPPPCTKMWHVQAFLYKNIQHHHLYLIHPVPALCQINTSIPAVSSNFLFVLPTLNDFSVVSVKSYWKTYLNYTDFVYVDVWKFGERGKGKLLGTNKEAGSHFLNKVSALSPQRLLIIPNGNLC